MPTDSHYGTQADPYVLGDGADLWDDVAPQPIPRRSRQTVRASTYSREEVQDSAASTTTLGSASGLRSRKASVHRRAASLASSSHPLQSPSSPNTETDASAKSRHTHSPRRKRQASENNLFDGRVAVLDEGFERETVRDPEIMVIVHEVSDSDSIAGVALKYGIALADLRKANRLLASDTIHLRKELYIPIHLSDRKYTFFNLNDLTTGDELNAAETDAVQASSSAEPSVTIKRVPASKLAFFPPPSHSSSYTPQSPHFASASSASPANYSSSTLNLNLSMNSFLRSLPLPSRDTLTQSLFSRLAFDSSEPSPASTPNVSFSETSSEIDSGEVEMAVLNSGDSREYSVGLGLPGDERRASSTRSMDGRTRGKERSSGRKMLHLPQPNTLPRDTFEFCLPSTIANGSPHSAYNLTSKSASPHPPNTDLVNHRNPSPSIARSEQMRPSPQMQLPRPL